MKIADNADNYAAPRTGVFFTANNQTSSDGNLTGQCVTLVKWFMQDMSDVPAPFSARGDARYVGDNLVAQGHAKEVPFSDRKRGDIVVWKYGQYGHIAVLLSGDRVFQQNVGFAGTPSRIVDGYRVYASRIDPLKQSWQTVGPTFYRLNTYKEGEKMKWNNGQTYNLLFHTLNPEIAERAAAANYVGYFGLQGNGEWDMDKAMDAIITSFQYKLLQQESRASKGFKPYDGAPLFLEK